MKNVKLNNQVTGIDLKELGKTMRWYRRSFNMSQRELAERTGISVLCINQWERGLNKFFRVDGLVKMAQLFGVSELDLLYPSDEVKKWINMSSEEP